MGTVKAVSGFDIRVEDAQENISWRFEPEFLASNWTCIWGQGCQGILDDPAEELQQGCCSVGAELLDEDEARRVSALAASTNPERFQYAIAAADGVFSDSSRRHTRVIDGACIFLNRPGFEGGEGCALHLLADDDNCSPVDYKPSVCWQLPIKVEWNQDSNGQRVANVRAWQRKDWGAGGTSMAWCCTESQEAYCGDERVVDSLRPELEALVGREVYVELRRQVDV